MGRPRSVALGSGLRELEAFEEAVRAMRSGFAAFREMSATELALMRSLLAERKTKLEMEVRADETRKFISTMSHEMRTPLNGILGMLQLARDCTLPAEAAEFVEAASLSGEHLLSIVNDVLDLQKIEAGLIELQSGPMRVAEIVPASPSLSRARRGAEGRGAGRQVEASVRIVAPRASAKGLLLAAVIADDVPAVVVGDADRTRQCLLNLVSNAVKYTLRGSVEARPRPRPPACPPAGRHRPSDPAQVLVTVEAEAADAVVVDASHGPPGVEPSVEEPGAPQRFLNCEFAVLDSGPGIALEARQQLFTRFYRVQHDPARGADPGCTGLGLAISREIVTKMGGEIGCASEVGRGSTFYFTRHPAPAPLAPASSALLHPAPSSPGASRGGPGVARPAPGPAAAAALSILVVEDHAMNLRVLRTMLEKEGHRAVEAFEAAGAPDCFHLVFMDCSMPVMDGFEATRRIRALERARGWRRHFIVALTGHASTEDGAACLSAGMDKWLTKPIRKSILLETVGTALFAEERSSAAVRSSLRGRAAPQIEALTGAAPRSGPERSPSPSPSALLRPRSTPLAAASTRVLFMPTLRRVRSDSQCSPPSRGPDGRPPPLNAAPGPPPIELPPAAVEGAPSVAPPEALSGPLATALLAEAAAPPAGGAGRRAAERGERWAPSLTPPPSMSDAGDRERFLSVCSAGECAGAGIGAGIGARGRWAGLAGGAGLAGAGGGGAGGAPPPLEVLVADDNAMNRRVLKALLAREGHRVQVAEDGRRRWRSSPAASPPRTPGGACRRPLRHLSMPRLDGIGATRRIRELERGRPGAAPRTFIVACTALSSQGAPGAAPTPACGAEGRAADHANVLEAGMQELLVKPVTRAGILAMLAKCGGGNAGPAAGPAGAASGPCSGKSSPLVPGSPAPAAPPPGPPHSPDPRVASPPIRSWPGTLPWARRRCGAGRGGRGAAGGAPLERPA
eukprot:tig00000140_g8470.t1